MYFGTSKVTFKTLFALFDLSLLWPVVSTGSTTALDGWKPAGLGLSQGIVGVEEEVVAGEEAGAGDACVIAQFGQKNRQAAVHQLERMLLHRERHLLLEVERGGIG